MDANASKQRLETLPRPTKRQLHLPLQKCGHQRLFTLLCNFQLRGRDYVDVNQRERCRL